MRKSLLLIFAFLFVIGNTEVASAHAVLIGSTPAAGSKVHALPSKITLKFADPLLILGKKAINRVVVTDPNSVVVSTGSDAVKGAGLINLIVDPHPINGIYRVSYRVSAQDGHIVAGAFSFTLQR